MELTDAQKKTIEYFGLEVVGFRCPLKGEWLLAGDGFLECATTTFTHNKHHVVRPALAATVKELEAELLRVRTTGHAAAHHLDNMAIEQGFGAALPPMAIADAVRRKIAALESELAPIWALKVGSLPWALSVLASGGTVMDKDGDIWSIKDERLGFMVSRNSGSWVCAEKTQLDTAAPFTLHQEPPPAPTADDLAASIESILHASLRHGVNARLAHELDAARDLASAYRAANAKGGV